MIKKHWPLLLCLQLSLVIGAVSFNNRVLPLAFAANMQWQAWESFKSKTIPPGSHFVMSAFSTRPLTPALIAGASKLSGLSFLQAFLLVRLASIFAAMLAFYWFLSRRFSQPEAVIGLLFLAATLPLTFNNHFEVPTDFPELLAFTLGTLCIFERRDYWLCAVVFFGTLNRETACFLPLIFLLVRWQWPITLKLVSKTAAVGFSWLIPFALLRYRMGIGAAGQYGDSFTHNLQGLARFFENLNPYNNYLFYAYLFGFLWLLPFIRFRSLPEEMRRALLAVPVMLAVYLFAGGYADEPREIIPLYALLVPAGLYALQESINYKPTRR
jgi:hypothetical protein